MKNIMQEIVNNSSATNLDSYDLTKYQQLTSALASKSGVVGAKRTHEEIRDGLNVINDQEPPKKRQKKYSVMGYGEQGADDEEKWLPPQG